MEGILKLNLFMGGSNAQRILSLSSRWGEKTLEGEVCGIKIPVRSSYVQALERQRMIFTLGKKNGCEKSSASTTKKQKKLEKHQIRLNT